MASGYFTNLPGIQPFHGWFPRLDIIPFAVWSCTMPPAKRAARMGRERGAAFMPLQRST